MRSESAAATTATVRVLAIADTDPYLKSSTTTLDALPDLWQSRQLLIQNPVMPSKAQIQAATSRSVEFVSHAALTIVRDLTYHNLDSGFSQHCWQVVHRGGGSHDHDGRQARWQGGRCDLNSRQTVRQRGRATIGSSTGACPALS